MLCEELLERDHVAGRSWLGDGERTAQHSPHSPHVAGTGRALPRPNHRHQAGAGVGGDIQEAAVLHLLDLLLLLVLLSVCKLDHKGTAAAFHGQTMVHSLNGEDGDLAVGKGDEGAT